MSERSKQDIKPYLPRYQPLLPSVTLPHRRRRYSYPDIPSCPRVFTYYIDGTPARVINSYRAPKIPSCNKSSRVFLCSPSLGHHLTRVTGSASLYDLSSSHVYTRPRSILDISTRRCDDDNADIRQNICDSSSFCLDMTPSESGVSVGESEDWSVFGREDDNTSQHSSTSWSTFCDHDPDRRGLDNCSGTSFHGDGPHGIHHGNNDDDNFRNGNQKDHMPNQDPQNPENTHDRYSLNPDVRKTLKTVNTSRQIVNTEDQHAPNLDSHPGISYEPMKHNSRHTTEHTLGHTACVGCREDWQSESRDSVVCDTCCSSEWCSFPQLGQFDNCRPMLDLDITEYAGKDTDLSCDNGFSEGFYSDDLDSSVSGDIEATRAFGGVDVTRTQSSIEVIRTCGSIEVTREHDNRELTKIRGDMELTNTYGDMELIRTPVDIELTRTPGDIELTRTPGDMELTRTPGDMELTRTPGDMEFTRTPVDIEFTRTPGDIELTRTPVDIELTRTPVDIELTRTLGDMELTRTPGVMELTRTPGDMELTRTPGDMELTRSSSDMELTRSPGVMELTRSPGDMELTKVHGEPEATRFYSRPNSLIISPGDNTNSRVHRQKGSKYGTSSDEVCFHSEDGVQEVGDVKSVADVQAGTDVYSITKTYEGTDVYSFRKEHAGTDGYRCTDVHDSADVTDEVLDCADVYSIPEEVRDCIDMFSVTDKVRDCIDKFSVTDKVRDCTDKFSVTDGVHQCTDVCCVTYSVLENSDVHSMTEEVCVDTDVHSVTNVHNFRVVYSAKDDLQEDRYVYNLTEGMQEVTDVYSVTDKVQEGAFVRSVPGGVQKCTDVYSGADKVQKSTHVYSVTNEVQKGSDVYSGKDVEKHRTISNDECADSLEHRTVDSFLTTVPNDVKKCLSEMFSKHNFTTSGETLREVNFRLDERLEGGSTERCSENQILYNIEQVQANDVTEVQQLNQHTNLQTIRLLRSEDNENKDSVKLYDNRISQTVLATIKSGMSRENSEVLPGIRLCILDDSQNENDLCASEMTDDDAITSSVLDKNVSLSADHVVDECLVGYSRTTGDVTVENYPLLNSGDRVENINDIDSDKAALLLLSETVSKDDVNRWDLPGMREQRCVSAPERCVIDSRGESTDVRAEQIPLQQSSVCHQYSASVDAGINNNTSVENLIDSSQAVEKCVSCCSEFWEETQSSETVSEKTGSIKSKYTDIGINTDSNQAPPVKQRTTKVSQQFKSQLVISFDFCDVSGKLRFCVCCGKRRKTYMCGLVCADCVINLYNNSEAGGERIINYCCGRKDIDWRAGIPVSILDESIKHAREKLRRNKDSQHVEHFCAATQGVGSGKTDEIIRYGKPKQQEATKSSSTHDSHTVDYQRTLDAEAVDTNLLSTFRSGTDKSSHLVLSQVSDKLDTASRISETCQINNGSILFSGLKTHDSVSIDKTSTDKLSSYSYVPSDFITLTASSDVRLKTDEGVPSIAPVCFTSTTSSILPRDTASDIQRMKENCSNLDLNNYVPSANVAGASDSTHRSRDSASSLVDLFTSGCHGDPLDNLHAQLSFISGNGFSERCQVPEHVATGIYRVSAEAACSWTLGHVGDTSDAVDFSNTPGGHAIKQAVLDPAAGKQHLTTYSRSLYFNQSSPTSDSLELLATNEEYDNDDTYVTAQTQRGSRLFPRSYDQMFMFRYGQAKASSLWTVPEEPENIYDETASHSSPTLPVEASSLKNSRSDPTMFVSTKPYITEDDTAVMKYSSFCKPNSKTCTLGNGSIITMEDSLRVFDADDNGDTQQSANSERVLSLLLDRDYISLDVRSNRICDRPAGGGASVECGSDKTRACDRFLSGVDKNIVASCSVQDSLVTSRQGFGDSSADDSDGMCHKRSDVCEDMPRENYNRNVSVLDRLSESLSQFGRHDVDLVYDRKSLFREDTADSDDESEECYSSSSKGHVIHMDGSGVSDLGYNDSGIISDLDSSTSSDSIKHIHFTSTGKAEFKDASFDDYDNAVCPRSRSDLVKTQTGFNQNGKHSDTSVESFEKIVEEMNISRSRFQEIAQGMLSQDEFSAKDHLPTPDCEGLYRAFTNEEAEKQQNHGCIVVEDEDVNKYRFKRFLKKSHNKRKKGLKILRFFSRLSCVAETASSPISSPVTPRKLSNKSNTTLTAEPEVLPKQTLSDPLLVKCTSCHHRETHSLPSVGNCNSPSTSNQSLDSVPSKTDSAYSSFSESTEAADSNPGNTITSNSQVHGFPDRVIKGVNMDSSIGSCSSSLDSSSSSLEVDVIKVSALDGVSLGTAAPKTSAPTGSDDTSDIFDELNTCEGEIDTALLTHMRYGHTSAKVDKTCG